MKLLTFVLFATSVLCVSSKREEQPRFIAHEWGTFTSLYGSDGSQLSKIYREEENLPGFVYKLQDIQAGRPVKESNKITEAGVFYAKTELKNVTVKMETPVIYFYSKDAFTANVKVTFNNGLIGQWYPQCVNKPAVGYREQTASNTAAASVELSGVTTNNFQPDLNPKIDFSNAANSAAWCIKVHAPSDMTTSVVKKGETSTWTTPRETDANIISYGKEREKYIFYRGLGNFSMPVKVSFDNSGRLSLENSSSSKLPYLFVYERKDDGKAMVYWTGPMEAGESRTVTVNAEPGSSFAEKILEFQQALVKAGLYDKEASAMLETWEKSYFNHPGLRVFWIAPRAFTDKIIPLTISPAPEKMERVLVGRSEILRPSFEKRFVENSRFRRSYVADRFYLAMEQRMNYLKAHSSSMEVLNKKLAAEAASGMEYKKIASY